MKTRYFLGITTIVLLAAEPFIFYQLGLEEGASNAQHERGLADSFQKPITDTPSQRIDPSPRMEVVNPLERDDPQQQPEPVLAVSTIGEALAIEHRELQKKAMVGLVQRLIQEDPSLDDATRKSLLRQLNHSITHAPYGLESSLAAIVVKVSKGQEIANSWRQAFANHPNRATIFSGLIDEASVNHPAELLALAEGWTEWEERVSSG